MSFETPVYGFSSLAIESDLNLPELAAAPGYVPQCSFRVLPSDEARSTSCRWLHHWRTNTGSISLSLARTGEGFVLRFAGLADFMVSFDCSRIRCLPGRGASTETIRHLLLDQVLPRVLSHRGRLVLHGSAVATVNGAAAFVGETGSGKSTLAAGFHRRGCTVLADDCLLLDCVGTCAAAVPTCTGIRLWPDSIGALYDTEPPLAPAVHYSDKKRLVLEGSGNTDSTASEPLRAIYVVDSSSGDIGTFEIEPMSRSEAVIQLVRNAFVLDVTDRQGARDRFERLGQMAGWLPLYRLTVPRCYSALERVMEEVVDHLRSPGEKGAPGPPPE